MIRFFCATYTEFKAIIPESVDKKGVVSNKSHHVKFGSDSAICVIRFFCATCTKFKVIIPESVDMKGVVCNKPHYVIKPLQNTVNSFWSRIFKV